MANINMQVQGALVSYACGCLDWLSGKGHGARLRTCPQHQASIDQAVAELERGEGSTWEEVSEELTAELNSKEETP